MTVALNYHYLQTDINITSSSLTSTSVTISWTQPQSIHSMDAYRIDLRRVTGARQLCQEVEDYKSKMTTGGASTLSLDFSNLHEFSIYSVTITVILPSGFTATLTPTVEFTTKAAGMDLHYIRGVSTTPVGPVFTVSLL